MMRSPSCCDGPARPARAFTTTIAITIALLAVSGCAHWFGPAHGSFVAVGATPEGGSCQLSVAALDSRSAPDTIEVAGSFRQRFIINPSRRGHRIALVCAGRLAAERVFKYGRDLGFGEELAVSLAPGLVSPAGPTP